MSRAKALDGIRAEEYMMLKAVILANSAAPSGTNDEKHDKLKSDILGSFHDCVAATRYVSLFAKFLFANLECERSVHSCFQVSEDCARCRAEPFTPIASH